jgi:hypothetical protein
LRLLVRRQLTQILKAEGGRGRGLSYQAPQIDEQCIRPDRAETAAAEVADNLVEARFTRIDVCIQISYATP